MNIPNPSSKYKNNEYLKSHFTELLSEQSSYSSTDNFYFLEVMPSYWS